MPSNRQEPVTENELEILRDSERRYREELEKLSPVEELIWALIIFALGLALLASITIVNVA